MRSWEMSEAQRQAVQKRADVEILEQAISRLEETLSEARAFESHYAERRHAIHAKLATLHFRRYAIHSDAEGLPLSGPPPAAWAEYEDLTRQAQAVENEQQRQVDARRVHATDAMGLDASWSPLSANDVERKLGRLRLIRNVTRAALANLEGQLSAGQLVQTGVPAEAFSEHVERVTSLREPAPAA